MTKLEQCVRLTKGMDAIGMVTIGIGAGGTFTAESLDGNGGVIASSSSAPSLEEAIDALHAAMKPNATALREVIAAFEE